MTIYSIEIFFSLFEWSIVPWAAWKGKKIWDQETSTSGQIVSNMLLGKSRGQLQIAPERMK